MAASDEGGVEPQWHRAWKATTSGPAGGKLFGAGVVMGVALMGGGVLNAIDGDASTSPLLGVVVLVVGATVLSGLAIVFRRRMRGLPEPDVLAWASTTPSRFWWPVLAGLVVIAVGAVVFAASAT